MTRHQGRKHDYDRSIRAMVGPKVALAALKAFQIAVWGLFAAAIIVPTLQIWHNIRARSGYDPVQVPSAWAVTGTGSDRIFFHAINLNRQIVIQIIPVDQPMSLRQQLGPYLYGSGREHDPLALTTADVNDDHLLDFLLTVDHETVVYLKDGPDFGHYKLMTADDHRKFDAQILQLLPP